MFQKYKTVPSWHRNLLIIAAIFATLLIAAGGVLCVTGSIRDCPDWPGCFGQIIPPLEKGPILEVTHRALAATTGLLILASSVAGLVLNSRIRWVIIPPLVSVGLLLLVSYFGARVVLRGLAPGWAAVDVGSALLVVALMVTTAVNAVYRKNTPSLPDRLKFSSAFAKLLLISVVVVYVVLLSGVLVAGENSLVGCLGWPIYSLGLFQTGVHTVSYAIRLILSIAGVGMLVAVLRQAWLERAVRPGIYSLARWVGIAFLFEALLQVLGLAFGFTEASLVVYTITAAAFWALLLALLAKTGLEEVSQVSA